jgi:hypothetical protein
MMLALPADTGSPEPPRDPLRIYETVAFCVALTFCLFLIHRCH